jgi:phage I-like protein
MNTAPHIALMAALPLPELGSVPDWVHVLPVGPEVATYDGRGPYRYADGAALIAASLARKPRLIVDENHATELEARQGRPAPARGFVEAMEERPDGIWARVDWNPSGRALLSDRAYWGLSPVIEHDAQGRIARIRSIALTNEPNLRGLTALNQETSMTFMEQLAEKLGLPGDATEDQILAAIPAKADVAPQSALTEIGTVLGVEGGDQAAIIAAARARVSATALNAALQAENTQLSARLATMEAANRRAASQAWLTAKLARHAIPATDHDTLLSLHMDKPETAERVAGLWPPLGTSLTGAIPPAHGGTITALNAEQVKAADLLGIPHDTYLATLQAEQKDRI